MSMSRQAGIFDAVRRAGGLKSMGLRTSHLVVLLCMADHESNKGQCNPTSETIAEETGQNARGVRTLWGDLRRRGFIVELARKRTKNGVNIFWSWDEERLPRAVGDYSDVAEGTAEAAGDDSTYTQGTTRNAAGDLQNHSGHHEPLNRIMNEISKSTDSYLAARQSGDGEGDGDGERPKPEDTALDPQHREQPVHIPGDAGNSLTNTTTTATPVKIPAREDLLALTYPDETHGSGISPSSAKAPPTPLPTLPVLQHLLDLLAEKKITRPRRKDTWATLEARLLAKLSPDELAELAEGFDWVFAPDSPPFWLNAMLDLRKNDLIGFIVNNSERILANFQMDRAKKLGKRPPGTVDGRPRFASKVAGGKKTTAEEGEDDDYESDDNPYA